ncbi:MAG: hypothetical protein H0V81_01675 [Solirubrobacterales bacterium]|nr:hypothetical protein [Solirubrobacterales bacterium]
MRRGTWGVVLATVTVAATVPTVGWALTTTTKPRIQILGGASFEANRFIQDKQRFNKDVYQVKSGAKIQINSKTKEEPHTVSVVSRRDLPKSVADFGKCYRGGICAQLEKDHGAPENGEGPPTNPLVDKGATGFDARGDSIVIDPGGKGRFTVSAKKGRTLYIMCVIHPWMQAKIKVK